MYETRFIAYDKNTAVSVLDGPASWEWNPVKNGTPVLKISFFKKSVAGQTMLASLADPAKSLDIAIEFRWRQMLDGSSSAWAEPPSGRFIVMEDDDDPSKDDTLLALTSVGVDDDLAGLYDVAIRANPNWSKAERKANYSRIFTSTSFNFTPGTILGDVLNDAKGTSTAAAGHDNFLPLLSYAFSSGADSNQVAWANTLRKFTWPADSSIRNILTSYVELGVADWWFEGNRLCVFNPGTAYRRLDGTTAAGEVALLLGRDITDAPQTRSRRVVTRDFIVMGENGIPRRSYQTGSTTKRGSRFTTVQGGSVDSSADAQALGAKMIDKFKRPSLDQMTRTLNIDDSTQTLPVKDYFIGDVILAPGANGQLQSLRIESLTLTGDSDGRIGGSLIFSDVFSVNPTAERVSGMTGGSSIPTVAGVARPMLGGESAVIDTMVTNLVTNSTSSLDVGESLDLQGVSGTHKKTGDLHLTGDSQGGRLYSYAVYGRTYSSAANMYITSSFTIGRTTSASRYKINISEQDYGSAVLDLPIKTWYDKAACEAWSEALAAKEGDPTAAAGLPNEDIPALRRHVGLIAEDVEAAGLADLVTYDDGTGEIEGLQYDRTALLLIPIVRDQRDAIADLNERIDARDSVIEQLLARVDSLESTHMDTDA